MSIEMKSSRSRASLRTIASCAAEIATCLALASCFTACGGPEPEIRARLSKRELVIFNRGKSLSTPCWSCHDLYGEQNKVGPYLTGMYGRKAGGARFGAYSPAMKNSNIVWSDATLRAYLMDVTGFIPGTTMNAPGPSNRADVDALIFYLRLVTSAPRDP
jgi:cytochrome c